MQPPGPALLPNSTGSNKSSIQLLPIALRRRYILGQLLKSSIGKFQRYQVGQRLNRLIKAKNHKVLLLRNRIFNPLKIEGWFSLRVGIRSHNKHVQEQVEYYISTRTFSSFVLTLDYKCSRIVICSFKDPRRVRRKEKKCQRKQSWTSS